MAVAGGVEDDGFSTNGFAWIASVAVRHRRAVMALWVVLVLGAGVLGLRLPQRLGSGGFEVAGSQSQNVAQALQTSFPGQAAEPAIVVVTALHPSTGGYTLGSVSEHLRVRLAALPGVGSVYVPAGSHAAQVGSPGAHAALLAVALAGDQSSQIATASRLESAVARSVPAGFRAEVGGRAAMYDSVNRVSRADLERAEIVALPITLVVLLLLFGSATAAGLALALAASALVSAFGLLYLLSDITALSAYVTNTASIIGIGVGIDYSLFIISRFREERRCGSTVDASAVVAVSTAGRAVAISALTVGVAMGAMYVVDIQGFRSMADGVIIVVALASAAALTLLPALLSVIGGRIPAGAGPTSGVRTDARARGWGRWADRVMRRPAMYLGASVTCLLVMAVPLVHLHLGQPSASTLPGGAGPRVALEEVAADFSPGLTGPIEIVVPTPAGPYAQSSQTRLSALESLLWHTDGVQSVLAPPPDHHGPGGTAANALSAAGFFSRDGRQAHITVVGRYLPQSDAGQALVRQLRREVAATPGQQGVRVGGAGAADLDLTATLAADTPWVIAMALTLCFGLLLVSLRAPVLALKAVFMNLLSVGAAYGAVVAVFQWGWLSSVLRFRPEGQIQAFIPLFLFCILFGLSMDYEVFILSRVREEYVRSGDNRVAVREGITRTATIVSSAAIIMVTVFGAFAGNRLLAFKAIGLGLAIAVLLDATVIRLVCVPATMRLMGRWNWWCPRWLQGPPSGGRQSDEETIRLEPIAAPGELSLTSASPGT